MRIDNIRNILSQPAVMVGLVFAMFWLVSDFSARFLKEERKQKISQSDYTFTDFISRKLDADQYERIVSLFQPYIIKSEETVEKNKPKGLTAEEQIRQSGMLSEVFINDNRLVLKGIVQDKSTDKRTALIQVTNVKTAETKLERFYSNKLVFGYDMKILNSTQVQLSLNRDTQKQIITLTMFKVIKNEPAVN